jgi:hypothetical protein
MISMAAIVICGIVINGRERDGDSEILSRIIEKLTPGDKS